LDFQEGKVEGVNLKYCIIKHSNDLTDLKAVERITTMMHLTLEVPEQLGRRLQHFRDRWVEILEMGLEQIAATQVGLHSEVIDLLARGPSPEEIIAFRPSEEAVVRVSTLLERNQEGALSPDERAELEQYKNLDLLFSLIKAQARLNQPRQG